MLLFKKILVGAAVLLVGVLGYAATKPNVFSVKSSVEIKAPPEKVFALINDFHNWSQWSPYDKLDPAMKKTYSGAESCKGAVYSWAGNGKAGEGRMEIMDTTEPSKISIKLDFIKPFASSNQAVFELKPQGSGTTEVSWEMHGPSPYMMKVASIAMNLDSMIGQDFEAGLNNLKIIAEKAEK